MRRLARWIRHLATSPWTVRRAFPPRALAAIETEIGRAETGHLGQVRFVVEGALHGRALLAGQTPRQRALELFAQLGVWDTQANDGVLIYLLLADRQLEIVADRGLHARLPPDRWDEVARTMEKELRDGRFEPAVVGAIRAIAARLPVAPDSATPPDELPDRPLVL